MVDITYPRVRKVRNGVRGPIAYLKAYAGYGPKLMSSESRSCLFFSMFQRKRKNEKDHLVPEGAWFSLAT